MINKFKEADGSWNWKKVGALFLVPITMWTLSTWYARYSWMRDQCYKVAVNEKSVLDAKSYLETQVGVLHKRISEEQDKRELKDEKLMGLIIDLLKQQQNQIQLQQKQLEKEVK
jgi:hypothetical protein